MTHILQGCYLSQLAGPNVLSQPFSAIHLKFMGKPSQHRRGEINTKLLHFLKVFKISLLMFSTSSIILVQSILRKYNHNKHQNMQLISNGLVTVVRAVFVTALSYVLYKLRCNSGNIQVRICLLWFHPCEMDYRQQIKRRRLYQTLLYQINRLLNTTNT